MGSGLIKSFIKSGMLSERVLSSDTNTPRIDQALPQTAAGSPLVNPPTTQTPANAGPGATNPPATVDPNPQDNPNPATSQTESKRWLVSSAYHSLAAAESAMQHVNAMGDQMESEVGPEGAQKVTDVMAKIAEAKTCLGEMYNRK